MKETTIKIHCSLLKLIPLLLISDNQCLGEEFQTASSESHGNNGTNLNYRMTEIEAQNRQQKREIELLKIAADKDRQIIYGLSSRVALLEVSAPLASPSDDNILQRSKRPYRLLPPNSFR